MKMMTMIKYQLKLLFNNRIAVFAIIAAPLLLTFLFTFSAGRGKTNLYITDLNNSVYSEQLINMLKTHADINVISLSENEIRTKIDHGNISMGFIISQNFGDDLVSGQNIAIQMLQNYNTGDGTLLEQAVLNDANAIKKITLDSKVISQGLQLSNDMVSKQIFDKLNSDSTISVNEKTTSNTPNASDTASTKLLGFLVMFLWFVVVQGFRPLIEEKGNHTFERILGTPTGYTKYIMSKVVATYVFGLFVTAIILIAGKYIFHASLISNIPAEAVLFAIYVFALTGIIMMFVPFIKRQQSLTILGAVIMALTGILGGSFFSIDEIASNTIKLISKFTPESWAIKAISDVTFNNSSLRSELLPIMILAITGTLGFLGYFIITRKSNRSYDS